CTHASAPQGGPCFTWSFFAALCTQASTGATSPPFQIERSRDSLSCLSCLSCLPPVLLARTQHSQTAIYIQAGAPVDRHAHGPCQPAPAACRVHVNVRVRIILAPVGRPWTRKRCKRCKHGKHCGRPPQPRRHQGRRRGRAADRAAAPLPALPAHALGRRQHGLGLAAAAATRLALRPDADQQPWHRRFERFECCQRFHRCRHTRRRLQQHRRPRQQRTARRIACCCGYCDCGCDCGCHCARRPAAAVLAVGYGFPEPVSVATCAAVPAAAT
ncbi:hypothetical protein BC831DRAFT_505919, partial [Entophlyctis helioformis]